MARSVWSQVFSSVGCSLKLDTLAVGARLFFISNNTLLSCVCTLFLLMIVGWKVSFNYVRMGLGRRSTSAFLHSFASPDGYQVSGACSIYSEPEASMAKSLASRLRESITTRVFQSRPSFSFVYLLPFSRSNVLVSFSEAFLRSLTMSSRVLFWNVSWQNIEPGVYRSPFGTADKLGRWKNYCWYYRCSKPRLYWWKTCRISSHYLSLTG